MNKERRDMLFDVASTLEDSQSALQDIIAEEEEAYDSLSDGLQMSRTGDAMQEAISRMQGFSDRIDSLITDIENMAKNKKPK